MGCAVLDYYRFGGMGWLRQAAKIHPITYVVNGYILGDQR